jgi:hypothetical protein
MYICTYYSNAQLSLSGPEPNPEPYYTIGYKVREKYKGLSQGRKSIVVAQLFIEEKAIVRNGGILLSDSWRGTE